MNSKTRLVEEFEQIVAEDGPWTAHYLDLGGGLRTLPQQNDFERDRAAFFLQYAQLLTGKPPENIRALDIGSLEGGISIWLGKFGCEVVGLEIRDVHIRKAQFAAKAMGLDRVRFQKGDMLKVGSLDLGVFDLIVCAGTLYHVDAGALVRFTAQLNDICVGIAGFDTHVADVEKQSFIDEFGVELVGRSFIEHVPGLQDQKEGALWASRHNDYAFWPTERSLSNLLIQAGFSHVMKPSAPKPEWSWMDRDYWVASSSHLARQRGLDPNPERDCVRHREWRERNCPAILNDASDIYPDPKLRQLPEPHRTI